MVMCEELTSMTFVTPDPTPLTIHFLETKIVTQISQDGAFLHKTDAPPAAAAPDPQLGIMVRQPPPCHIYGYHAHMGHV